MPPSRAYVLLTLTTLCWAGNAVAGKLAVDHISPLLLTMLRWCGAVLIVTILGHAQLRRDWPALKPKLGFLLLLGMFGFAGFNLLFYAAANHTQAMNLALLQAGIPGVIFILSFLMFRQTVAPLQFAGLMISMLGAIVAASRGELSTLLALTFNRGDALMLVAVLLYGAYAVFLKFKPDVHWQSLMIVMGGAALLTTIPFALWELSTDAAIIPDLQGWLVIAYVAIFPSIVAQVLFMAGVAAIGANRAGVFIAIIPIAGTILSIIILRETPYLYHAIALALVICGIVLAEMASLRAERRRTLEPTPPSR